MGKAAQVSYMFLLWYMQPGWKSLCLCPLDQCSALFRRLCSAGCQLPIGHRHHLPTQRRMREEDLHPSRIHADGCRLVETRAQPELYTLQRWRQINSQFFSRISDSQKMFHTITLLKNHSFLGEVMLSITNKGKKKKWKDKRINWSLLGNQRLRGTCRVWTVAGRAQRDLEPVVQEQLHLFNTGHWFRLACDLSPCRFHSNRKWIS